MQIWYALKRLSLGLALIGLAALVLLVSDRDRRVAHAASGRVLRVAIVQHASTPVLDAGVSGMIDGLAELGFRDGDRMALRRTTRRAISRPVTRSRDRSRPASSTS